MTQTTSQSPAPLSPHLQAAYDEIRRLSKLIDERRAAREAEKTNRD